MKKTTNRNLKLAKISIAVIDKLTEQNLKGGTDQTSDDLPRGYKMSDLPDNNGICYQLH